MAQDRRIQKAIGIAVRELREQQGLSQQVLAQKGGFHRTYISKIERGEVAIRFITFLQLAEALNVSIIEFSRLIESHLEP